MRYWKLSVILLAVGILMSACGRDDGDTKVVYVNNNNQPDLPEPFLFIHNHVLLQDFNVLPGTQDRTVDNVFFEPTNSQEDMIVYSLVVEDTFTGSGDFTELENLEIWTNFNYFGLDYNLNDYVPTTKIAGPVNPTPGPSPGTLILTLDNPVILQRDKFLIMTIKADISAGADNTTPATHTIKVIDAEVIGLESDTYCTLEDENLIIRNLGVILTLVDRGSVKLWASNPESLTSQILINGEGTNGYKDILKFNLIVDDAENINLTGFNFSLEGKSGNSFYRVESDSFSAGWIFPNPVTGPFGISFGPYPTVLAGSNLETTLQFKGGVAIPYTVNGDSFRINSVAAYALGADSGQPISYDTDQVNMPWMYLYATRPAVVAVPGSPQQDLIPGVDRPIAAFIILAHTGGDISFSASKGNSLTVSINSRCEQTTVNDMFYLKDEVGTVLSSFGPVDICSSQDVTFNFELADLYIVAGTSKNVIVSADTLDFSNSGDFIQAYLSEADPNNIGWYIPNQFSLTSNNHHADIIFRGNIYGSTLIVP